MPRDLKSEIVELKSGIHQFIMTMYNCIEKLVDERDAKIQVIKVLQEEIDYVSSTDASLQQKETDLIDLLKKEKLSLEEKFRLEKDDFRRHRLSEIISNLHDVIIDLGEYGKDR